MLVSLGLGVWLLVAMADYDPRQHGLLFPDNTTEAGKAAANWSGRLGTDCARLGFDGHDQVRIGERSRTLGQPLGAEKAASQREQVS